MRQSDWDRAETGKVKATRKDKDKRRNQVYLGGIWTWHEISTTLATLLAICLKKVLKIKEICGDKQLV